MKTISFIDDEFNSNDFDLIITDDFCQTTVKSEYLEKILNSDSALLSLNNGFGETYFSNSSKVFNLKFDKYQQYIEFSEDIFVQDFVKPLFSKLGFNNLYYQKRYKLNDHILRPDFVAFDKNGNAELLCEVKYYRDRVLSQGLYHTIVYKFCKYKSAVNAKHNILLLLSNVDKNSKAELFENFGIIIWDLSNLLYLTQGDLDLYKRLLTMVNYPINDIIPEKPYKYEEVCKKETDFSQEECKQKNYIQKLKKCSYGKEDEADKKFENLCIDIIDYLFEGEFRKIKPQQTCSDNLHRVDLLVGIKGTKEFWDLLIKHYNTRFVVFEFKNYKEELKQNLIYTTEKYLYNVALRNVAIIISRKGFSENAQKAANGCLRENGKLILDLSEDDLISMLEGKEEGQEPSEYLYQKLEDLLISVGK